MKPTHPIYLDAHATTPPDPRVVEAMLPTLREQFGNAASRQHAYGWEAEALVEQARERVAALIHAEPAEIVFTSGATESINTAIKGFARLRRGNGGQIVTCATEHKAVLDTCRRLQSEGFQIEILPVNHEGMLDLDQFNAALRENTILVSLMLANNEIGVLHPIEVVGQICHERGILFHCDAVQAAMWEPIDVRAQGIDLLSLSAHKMHGPKGVGALYVRRRAPRVRLEPLIDGGGHERGLRSGTLNVPGIVGFGRAAELVMVEREGDARRIRKLRDRLMDSIMQGHGKILLNGALDPRLPNNLNLSFRGARADALLRELRDVALSSGAACTSATPEPSHVLRALGCDTEQIESSLRFGLHRFTFQAEIDLVAGSVGRALGLIRAH